MQATQHHGRHALAWHPSKTRLATPLCLQPLNSHPSQTLCCGSTAAAASLPGSELDSGSLGPPVPLARPGAATRTPPPGRGGRGEGEVGTHPAVLPLPGRPGARPRPRRRVCLPAHPPASSAPAGPWEQALPFSRSPPLRWAPAKDAALPGARRAGRRCAGPAASLAAGVTPVGPRLRGGGWLRRRCVLTLGTGPCRGMGDSPDALQPVGSLVPTPVLEHQWQLQTRRAWGAARRGDRGWGSPWAMSPLPGEGLGRAAAIHGTIHRAAGVPLLSPCRAQLGLGALVLEVRHGMVWQGMVQYGTARHGSTWHGTAQRGTAHHRTARYGLAQLGTAQNGTARRGTAWLTDTMIPVPAGPSPARPPSCPPGRAGVWGGHPPWPTASHPTQNTSDTWENRGAGYPHQAGLPPPCPLCPAAAGSCQGLSLPVPVAAAQHHCPPLWHGQACPYQLSASPPPTSLPAPACPLHPAEHPAGSWP